MCDDEEAQDRAIERWLSDRAAHRTPAQVVGVLLAGALLAFLLALCLMADKAGG